MFAHDISEKEQTSTPELMKIIKNRSTQWEDEYKIKNGK